MLLRIDMLKYLRAFAVSFGYVLSFMLIMIVLFGPFYFILTYIPPSALGLNLMFGWLVVVLVS